MIIHLFYFLRLISCTAATAFPSLSIWFLLFFFALMFINYIISLNDAITIRRKQVQIYLNRILHLLRKHSPLDKM